MQNENAAGRKTEYPRPRHHAGQIELHLDAPLALMTEGMREAFARAAAIPETYEDSGRAREREFGNGTTLAKTSAERVLALAKLNGQFSHDINVRHHGRVVTPPPSESRGSNGQANGAAARRALGEHEPARPRLLCARNAATAR
jgi:hypothetical protein